MWRPLNVPSLSPFQYSLFSKPNTCDIKIKLLSPDLGPSLPDKTNRARQHLNTDKEKLALSALQIHMKVRRGGIEAPPTDNFSQKILANVFIRDLNATNLCHERWNKTFISCFARQELLRVVTSGVMLSDKCWVGVFSYLFWSYILKAKLNDSLVAAEKCLSAGNAEKDIKDEAVRILRPNKHSAACILSKPEW